MESLFTVHAGELLVGSQIEQRFKNAQLWLPAKDTGVDILVTSAKRGRTVSLQVKFSHDFLITHMKSIYQEGLVACGWWTHSRKKILASKADLWVFALQAFDPKRTQYVLISPKELHRRLSAIHGSGDRVHSYLWVTKKGKCWEARGLSKRDEILIANHAYVNPDRDFSSYLNTWDVLRRRLKLNRGL